MTTKDLTQLLANKTWRAEFTITSDNTLTLFLQDLDSGDCGLLSVGPQQLALPDECVLAYSYEELDAGLGVPEHLYDIATKVGPDFEKGEMPGLFQ